MIELRKVDADNLWDIAALSVAPHQKGLVSPNTHSIMEAYVCITSGGTALPFGIYADGVPVGFLMIGYGCADWPDAPLVAHDRYSLWRLMIDQRYQGRGYGKAALHKAIEYMKTLPCGPSDGCWLSYEPNNHAARRLYQSFGFEETGEMDGCEVIALLKWRKDK